MVTMGLVRRVAAALALVIAATVFPAPATAQPDSTNGWGYPLDSLAADLARWRAHPLMRVDSIGRSVQGRPIWRVTVGETTGVVKPRVFAHARTHPAEVQSFYVLREMLGVVTDTTAQAAALRRDFTFHFIPLYNPDGVALGRARHNANGIDIESNWNATTPQPEVAALKGLFQSLSTGPTLGTVRVALNLHSDQVNCTRFFFYHHENGTSAGYAAMQREYITGVRAYFPEGIQPWNYVVSWTGGFASQYPESFWWLTRGANTLALTYEDTNCPGAGDFYRTGRALVLGSADYLRNHPTVIAARGRERPNNGSGAVIQRGRSGPTFVERRDGRMILRDATGRILRTEP